MINFVFAFFLTFIIELFVIWLILSRDFELKMLLQIVFLINLFSLPFVWFVFPYFISDYTNSLLLSEIFVLFFEALLLSTLLSLNFSRAVFVSFVANLISFLVGFLFF